MIRSMTGWGDAEAEVEGGRARVEIKTVNHRYLNTQLRTPPGFDPHEALVNEWLRSHFQRGHIGYSLAFEAARGLDRPLPELDLERARHVSDLLRKLSADLGLGAAGVETVLRVGEVLRTPERAPWEPDLEVVEALTHEAAARVVAMRQAEGERLRADLEERLGLVSERLDEIEERAPERLDRERDRLSRAVRELTEGVDVDPDRIAREIVILAERWDVHEELVRFRSHIALFRQALADDSDQPVGKRLGFLVQEMLREANTIGSKANDSSIQHAVVSIKEEIERVREQVENVE